MYVPRMKNNLISTVVLEDHGHDVVFSNGKSFLRNLAIGQVKEIGFCVNYLYKLEVEACIALSCTIGQVQSWDVGELWHRDMGHLHHEALKIMQHITTGLPRCTLDQHDVCKGRTLGKYVKSTF